jgi:hypothetical protein
MNATANNKGLTIIAIILAFVALVYAFFQLHAQQNQVDTTPLTNGPVYQTGEAFEVIDPAKPSSPTSNKTPEQLVAEADQIIAETNLLIEQQSLGDATLSDAEKQAAEARVARLMEKINELEKQLAQ